MENKREKIEFNFDFLDNEKDSIDEKKERVRKIIAKIADVKENANTVSISKVEVLLEDISIMSEKLSNNNFYDEIFLAVKGCSVKLNGNKKYQESLLLLKFVYNLPKSGNNQTKCKELIDITEKLIVKSNEKKSVSTDKKDDPVIVYTKDEDNFFKIVLWISLVIVIVIGLGIGINAGYKNLHISKLENETYEYYKVCAGSKITLVEEANYKQLMNNNCEQIAKIKDSSKDNIEDSLYLKFRNKYKDEKTAVISKLASAYNNDKVEFNNLKEKYLPVYFKNNVKEFNQAIDSKLGYKELSLVPEPLPRAGLLVNYTKRQVMAPFQIITGSMHCYIKMYDAKSYKLALTIFAPANKITEVEVPLGSYIVEYARGYNWYGVNDLFGHDTIRKQDKEIIKFNIEGNYVVGKSLRLAEASLLKP